MLCWMMMVVSRHITALFVSETWKSNFSAGTRFTVRINDTEFNKFATVGEFVERGAHNVEMINTSPDTSRTRVNRHNVILEAPREEPGQHAKFKILKAAD